MNLRESIIWRGKGLLLSSKGIVCSTCCWFCIRGALTGCPAESRDKPWIWKKCNRVWATEAAHYCHRGLKRHRQLLCAGQVFSGVFVELPRWARVEWSSWSICLLSLIRVASSELFHQLRSSLRCRLGPTCWSSWITLAMFKRPQMTRNITSRTRALALSSHPKR